MRLEEIEKYDPCTEEKAGNKLPVYMSVRVLQQSIINRFSSVQLLSHVWFLATP